MLIGTRMRRRTIARTLTASVVALALAASVGCGGEPETNIKPADDKSKQSEQKDKPSPSPTPTFEDEPYVQVALEYYEAMNQAIKTGEVDRLRELSKESCEACYGTADRIEGIYEDGGHVEGGQTKPAPGVDIQARVNEEQTSATVVIVYRDDPAVMVMKKGAEPQEFPKEFKKQQFTLEMEGSKWIITKLLTSEYDG